MDPEISDQNLHGSLIPDRHNIISPTSIYVLLYTGIFNIYNNLSIFLQIIFDDL